MFLMLSSFSFAKNPADLQEIKLKSEFGQDLTHAPFFLRFSFSKEYDKDWKDSDYSERKDFLTQYENSSAAEKAKEKADARAQAAKDKETALEKKQEQRKIADRIKAQKAEEKAEKDAYKARQKAFNDAVKEEKKELKEMEQQLLQEEQAQQNNR